MSSSEDAIKRVVEAFERSDWSEIDVRSGDLRVHLSAFPDAASPDTTSTGPAVGRREQPQPVGAEPDPTMASSAVDPPPSAHVVTSPSPGIFWRAPEPGSPPFADVGQRIDDSATVCIIEVMKLMNHIKAGVGGVVVAVYGENGVAVRKGQALFAIDPSESSP